MPGHRHHDSRGKWTTTDDAESHPADVLTEDQVSKLLLIAEGGGGTTPQPPNPPSDVTPPIVSGVSASVTTTTATIVCTTDEAATVQVEYNTTGIWPGTLTAATTSGTSHSRTLTGLTPGQTYVYRIRATDASSNLRLDSNRSFTTTSVPTLPGAPQNLVATGGNTQVALTWAAPSSNGGSAITGYHLYRNGASLVTLGVVLTYTNTGLTNGLTYSYTVAAITAVGEGPQGNTASATPAAAGDINPPNVSNVVIAVTGQTTATVSCNTDEAATVVVEYGTTTAYGSQTTPTSSGTSHSRNLTGLTPATLYHVRIRATDTAGNLRVDSDRTFTTNAAVSTGFYGSGFSADDLNNSQVGGPNSQQIAYRFKAAYSSALNSVNLYIIGASHSGYGAGTGGTMRIGVFADSGGSPTGSALATKDLSMSGVDDASVVITWSSPATLVAGTVYHIVFTNIDGSPTANYVSLDGTFSAATDNPWQPRFPNSDWANVVKIGSGSWSTSRSSGVITPIADLTYANGSHQGQGYMETFGRTGYPGNPDTVTGTIKLRETFTISGGDRTVNRVYVRLAKTGSAGDLSLRLETSAGVEIETVVIPASSVLTATRGGHAFGQGWVSAPFASNHVLTNGQGYRLVLSTTSGEYWTSIIRKGASYGYTSATYFADGHAQIALDGSTWTNVTDLSGNPSAEGDLQFHFAVV